MNYTILKALLFSLLTLATFCTTAFIEQYQNTGPQILTNADFASDLSKWEFHKGYNDTITVKDGVVSLQSEDPASSVSLYRIIPNTFSGKTLQLRGLLHSKDIVAGEKPYNKARLLLVQYRHERANWKRPHTVIALEGTNDWQDVKAGFTISEDCSEFRIIIQMSRCRGEFFLKDLSLHQIEETILYGWIKWLIRGAWIFFICFLFLSYLKSDRIIVSKLPVLITVAAILIGTAMPATVKNNIKRAIDYELTPKTKTIHTHIVLAKDNLSQLAWLQTAIKQIDITKIAHFALFALLVLILRYNNPTLSRRRLLFDIFLLACATELNQFFVENRSPLITDVIIDMAGAGTGVLLSRKKPNRPG